MLSFIFLQLSPSKPKRLSIWSEQDLKVTLAHFSRLLNLFYDLKGFNFLHFIKDKKFIKANTKTT